MRRHYRPVRGTRFTCGYCGQNPEAFRAIDHVPTHTHVCYDCFHALCEDSPPDGIQEHYEELWDPCSEATGTVTCVFERRYESG